MAKGSVRWSISRRLVSRLTLALSGLWLLAVVVAALVVRHEINETFDSALQETAQRLLPLAAYDLHERGEDDDDDDDDDGGRLIDDSLLVAEHEEYLTYQVRNAAGRVLIRSHDAPAAAFPVPLRAGFHETQGRRFYTEAALGGGLFIQVAEPLAHRTAAISDSLLGLVAPLLVLVPLAGLAIRLTVRQATRPIAELREEIGRRGGANLAAIPEGSLPEELAPIIRDVNRLLQRLGRALEGERAFAANSAHELRTPVAAALAQTQRLAARLAGTPDRERAEQIAATLRRLADLVEKLLQLARAEAGLALSRERVDLLPVLRLLVDEYRRRGDVGDRLRFDDGGFAELLARADIDAVGIVLRNLFDNAVIHGPAGTPIDVQVTPGPEVRVTNAGPAVAPQDLAKLKQRFERAAATGSGSGLGLAIADAIMRQSGGALEIRSPAPGREDGFEAVLRFDRTG